MCTCSLTYLNTQPYEKGQLSLPAYCLSAYDLSENDEHWVHKRKKTAALILESDMWLRSTSYTLYTKH